LGLLIDAAVGEPPASAHPVASFGTAMATLEGHTYRDSVTAGAVHLSGGLVLACLAAVGSRHLLGATASTAGAVALCSAGRMLDREALAVAARLEAGDLDGARTRVAGLVGRDTTALGAGEVARATIESVAENHVDAVVATMVWAALGGAAGAWVHRAVNTLDAMVGHRNDRYLHFGRVPARVDDAINYLPARLAALSVVLVRPTRAGRIVRSVKSGAGDHPSPNGGVIEAAFAAALGVTLGGTNVYGGTVENRGTLGFGPAPDAGDIRRAVGLRRRSTLTALVLLASAEVAWTATRR